jgi:hypothetical protein
VTTQVVPEQNESCVAVAAKPPAVRATTSVVELSEARLTWYILPPYES